MPKLKALKNPSGVNSGLATLYGTRLPIGFDIETTGLDPRKHKLVSIAFKPEGRLPVIIDARDYSIDLLCISLQPLFINKNILLRGHNLAFDLLWMRTYIGIPDIKCSLYDTQLAELAIRGIGWAEAEKQEKGSTGLGAIGGAYGIEVHKEERKWFIGLDKRVEGWMIVNGERVWAAKWDEGVSSEDIKKVGLPVCTGELIDPIRPWNEPFPYEQLEYMRQDVSVPHRIAQEQQRSIKEQGLERVVELEMGTIPATVEMSHRGLWVDLQSWTSAIDAIKVEADRLAEEVHEYLDVPILETRRLAWEEKARPYQQWVKGRDEILALGKAAWKGDGWGEEKKRLLATYTETYPKPTPPTSLKTGVNLNSPPQIKTGFQGLGFAIDGASEGALEPFANDIRIHTYLEYAKHKTNIIKFGDRYIEEHITIDPETDMGRMFPKYGQYNAGTGRYSSYDPNAQQIPNKGVGAALRKAIAARPGYKLLDMDFNNVELRMLAELSGDPVMLAAFASGKDLHALTAVTMFGLEKNPDYVKAIANGMSSKEWTKAHDTIVNGVVLKSIPYRHTAKTINFLLANGGGAMRLAGELLIEVSVSKALMALHRQTYSVAFAWLKQQGERLDRARSRGEERVFNFTVSGRRRWLDIPKLVLPEIVTPEDVYIAQDKWKAKLADIRRQLMNVTMQGSSADITKKALRLFMERYNCDNMYICTCVHDEIVVMVKEELVEEAMDRLIECMSEAFKYYMSIVDPGKFEPVVSDRWEKD